MTSSEKTPSPSSENAPKPIDDDTNEPANPSGNKKTKVRTPWTHPVLQGDDNEHSGFGFPTITSDTTVELGPEQLKKAKAAAKVSRFRLKEVK